MNRGMYGFDLMIEEDFKVRVTEVTFSPDCDRACRFNPQFFNSVFNHLFMNEMDHFIDLKF